MFQSARLQLTAWYLAIIMLISIVFSVVIYTGINRELERFERFRELRQERMREGLPAPQIPRPLRGFDPEMISQAKMRLSLTLALINLGILSFSGFAGYFLAGRTLRPIKEMISEQNRFITDASHELRTPLTALKTSIEVHLRNKNLTLQQAKKLLESNLEEVNAMQILSNELIRLAQFQKPNGSFAFEKEVSIRSVVDAAKQKVAALAKKKKIKVTVAGKDALVEADKKSLIELVTILLDNAIKYSPRSSSVLVSVIKTDNHAVVEVSDEGPGIAQSDILYIFDRFYRGEKSRSKEIVPGYGLGLSIAKKIVAMHNGLLEVTSKKDKGTTFTVSLPLKH